MTATILDGRAIARDVRSELADRVEQLGAQGAGGVPVRLDAILVGQGTRGSRQYADNQCRTCRTAGIDYRLHELDEKVPQSVVEDLICSLNKNDAVSAIMLHLPLPEGMDIYALQSRIVPSKDCEGVNPANIGNIVYGRSSLVPCTALAVMRMLKATGQDLQGQRAVVVGASNHVGKPIAVLLMQQNATVVSCNKWTVGLKSLCQSADIVVAAAGVPGLVTGEMVKSGAVVIDVGVNRVVDASGQMQTVGDVAFDEVQEVAGYLSPVPGGVGPVTVAMLLANAVSAAEHLGG